MIPLYDISYNLVYVLPCTWPHFCPVWYKSSDRCPLHCQLQVFCLLTVVTGWPCFCHAGWMLAKGDSPPPHHMWCASLKYIYKIKIWWNVYYQTSTYLEDCCPGSAAVYDRRNDGEGVISHPLEWCVFSPIPTTHAHVHVSLKTQDVHFCNYPHGINMIYI